MIAMENHIWYDDDVKEVKWQGGHTTREIIMKEGSLLIHREDVIALAKEFGLIVYDKDHIVNNNEWRRL